MRIDRHPNAYIYSHQSKLHIFTGKSLLYEQELYEQAVLVMGSEGQGISKDVHALIDHPVLIPRKGGAESLNVSIATAVILSEFTK